MSWTWPSSVPSDLVLTHTEGAPRNVAAFAPMVGPPLLYQVGDVRSVAVQGRIRITDAQRAAFLAWFYDDVAQGSRQFSLTSASFDGETWLCQFDAEQPFALEGAAAGWWLTVSLALVLRLA